MDENEIQNNMKKQHVIEVPKFTKRVNDQYQSVPTGTIMLA